MRRVLANLVLLVTLWGYAAPAALGATEAELPACCRGDGKHHCSMAGMAQPGGSAPGFSTNSPQCPYRLLGPVLKAPAAAAARKLFSLDLPAADLLSQRDAAFRESATRSRNSGRGPPALSL
jgi:hypothetical protein